MLRNGVWHLQRTTNTGLVRLRSGYVSGGLVADFHLSERNSSSHSQTVSVGLGTRIELGGNIAKVMWIECKVIWP